MIQFLVQGSSVILEISYDYPYKKPAQNLPGGNRD